MNSPSSKNSPKYKNLVLRHKQSPKELKDKMRQNYKDKVRNCRELLMDKFRGAGTEQHLCLTLTDIYKSMFNEMDFTEAIERDENDTLEELKYELIQEEMEWCLRDYEKSHLDDVDWSTLEQDDGVICPICNKSNFKLNNCMLVSCLNCKIEINTPKTLIDIKKSIVSCLEQHATQCCNEPQFTVIPDGTELHIYLICDYCSEIIFLI